MPISPVCLGTRSRRDASLRLHSQHRSLKRGRAASLISGHFRVHFEGRERSERPHSPASSIATCNCLSKELQLPLETGEWICVCRKAQHQDQDLQEASKRISPTAGETSHPSPPRRPHKYAKRTPSCCSAGKGQTQEMPFLVPAVDLHASVCQCV